jgi:hypothetical protein
MNNAERLNKSAEHCFSPRLSFIASKLDARVPGILLGDVTI